MKEKEIIHRLRGQLKNCINHLENANRHGYWNKFENCIESANRALYETSLVTNIEEKKSFSYQEILDSWLSRIKESYNSESRYARGLSIGMKICYDELQAHIKEDQEENEYIRNM